jgi:hypothetical protein
MDDRAERQRRLARARRLARVELAVAFGVSLFAGFLWVASPGMGGGFYLEPPLLVRLIPWVWIIGVVVGIVWMIRIYRADPEPVETTWRYRDF